MKQDGGTDESTEDSNARQLLSDHWRHVAMMRPRLRAQAAFHRQVLRGDVWYILEDSVNTKFHRIKPNLYRIVAQMDGQKTVQEIWKSALLHEEHDCPTQEEVIQLLGRLHSADLIRGQLSPDIEEIARRARFINRRNLLARFRSPLAIRVPLWDPDRFLDATMLLVRPVFSLFGAIAWLAGLLWGISLAVTHWGELSGNVADRVLSADNLLMIWILFPLVKFVHELGHGYAAKRWGAEVHEMGVMFLVFVPVPYVEASAATAFPSRWQRALVSAGGMFAEIPLAVLALWLWTELEPGLARSAMYNVVLIAGVSTVLFNGNPLLRFDGYYILMDLIEMPNLGPRSNRYIGYLIQRYVFNVEKAVSTADSPDERKILLVYSVASYFYRLVVMSAIVLFVATKFFIIGILLAVWATFQMFVMPVLKLLWFVLASPVLKDRRTRAIGLTGSFVAVIASGFLFVPAPLATVSEGVIKAPEHTSIYAQAEGFVSNVTAAPNQTVAPGDVLLSLEAPLLEAEISVLKAQSLELEALLQAAQEDPAQARLFRAEIDHVSAQLVRARERQEALVVRAPRSGAFLTENVESLLDRYLVRGQSPGYVSDLDNAMIEAALPAYHFDLLRNRLVGVQVRPAWDLSLRRETNVALIEPGTTRQLRSAVLAASGGGPFSLEPAQGNQLLSIEDVFHVRLTVPEDWDLRRVGDRVYVLFDLGTEPLGFQIYRVARRLFLRRFDV